MMSSESPGDKTPDPPIELKDMNHKSSSVGVASASVLMESKKPITNTQKDDEAIETIETPQTARKHNSHSMENGFVDDPDGAIKLNNLKSQPQEEEDGCGVKCLYYTLQCCECTVM